jgi:tetratricopeptide (TPR) repeat protein
MSKRIIFFITFSLMVCSFALANGYLEVVNKGILLLKQGRYEESLKVFESAQKLGSENSNTYYYIGEVLYRLGNTNKAIDSYKKAIEIQPSVPEYYFSLGMVYLSINNVDDALENLNKTIEIAPKTIVGKQASRLKEEITSSISGSQLVKKWVKLEEEETLRLKEAEKKEVPEGADVDMEGFPGEADGSPQREVVPKEDVRRVIKKIRFETETARKRSASVLPKYKREELQQVVEEVIEIAKEEKDVEVNKNLLLALGKAATDESIQFILKELQNIKQTFDVKIVALESLSKLESDEITNAARGVLNGMVLNREKERKDAQKQIADITKKIDGLMVKKDENSFKSLEVLDKITQLSNKLQEMSAPGDFGDGQPQQKRPSVQELGKLRRDLRAQNNEVTKLNRASARIDAEIGKLQQERLRYESLLVERDKNKDINFQSRQSVASVPPGNIGFEDFLPDEGGVYIETDEEKNEIIFAISLIKALGKMRDKEGLGVIKKGWDEYGVEQQKIYYLLSLARLSDFSGINELVLRLRSDYPTGPLQEELSLRSGIIEVLGDYLIQNPDEKLYGLIEYLSEGGGYPEIKRAASGVLSKTAQRSK